MKLITFSILMYVDSFLGFHFWQAFLLYANSFDTASEREKKESEREILIEFFLHLPHTKPPQASHNQPNPPNGRRSHLCIKIEEKIRIIFIVASWSSRVEKWCAIKNWKCKNGSFAFTSVQSKCRCSTTHAHIILKAKIAAHFMLISILGIPLLKSLLVEVLRSISFACIDTLLSLCLLLFIYSREVKVLRAVLTFQLSFCSFSMGNVWL